MNERIAKLKEQAKEKVISHGAYGEREIYWEINVDKFAELIVQECMNLVKDCYAEPQSGQSPYQTACASTIIEEHFWS